MQGIYTEYDKFLNLDIYGRVMFLDIISKNIPSATTIYNTISNHLQEGLTIEEIPFWEFNVTVRKIFEAHIENNFIKKLDPSVYNKFEEKYEAIVFPEIKYEEDKINEYEEEKEVILSSGFTALLNNHVKEVRSEIIFDLLTQYDPATDIYKKFEKFCESQKIQDETKMALLAEIAEYIGE